MTLDDCIAALALRGLRMNNLCQFETGEWRANCIGNDKKTGGYHHEFGVGADPYVAMDALVSKLQPVEFYRGAPAALEDLFG